MQYRINSPLVLFALGTAISWLVTALLLLVYSFGYFDSLDYDIMGSYSNLKYIVLTTTAVLAVSSIWFAGHVIDKKPTLLPMTYLSSLLLLLVCLLGLSLISDGLFVSGAFAGLGVALGVLTGSSGVYYGAFSPKKIRGRVYSYAIALFAWLSVLVIVVQTTTGQVDSSQSSFVLLSGLVVVALVLAVLVLVLRPPVTWRNDRWPTPVSRIFDRATVRHYLTTHFLLYLMVGLAIYSISAAGESLGSFTGWLADFDPVDLFWLVVFLGIAVAVLVVGFVVDKLGRRKTPGVLAIYGIAVALLIFDVGRSLPTYLLSAFLLGVSISVVNVTFDSAVWADLSPRDGLGRYFALGFATLIIGISVGYVLGTLLGKTAIDSAGLLLIFLAALSVLPMVFVGDSYEPLNFALLMVIVPGGTPCFTYRKFTRKQDTTNVDLDLLAGGLEALSNFMGEIMGDSDRGGLNQVRHGKFFILAETVGDLKGALLSNKTDNEVRDRLRGFLTLFGQQFRQELDDGVMNDEIFAGAEDIVQHEFGPLLPTQDWFADLTSD